MFLWGVYAPSHLCAYHFESGLLTFYAFPVAAATIEVDSAADNATASDTFCTLREAITNANSNSDSTGGDCVAGSGTDTISFNIPGAGVHTIAPTSDLPAITSPIIIDGTTQAGASCLSGLLIHISGASNASSQAFRIAVGGSGSTIRGLVINGFTTGVGITLITGSSNNTIQCNIIGADAAGTTAVANFTGVFVADTCTNNIIGTNGDGTNDANEGNLISGNSSMGITITGSGAANNRIAGNLIGTDITGTLDLGNLDGFQVVGGANANIIGTNGDGTADALERNIISGNNRFGILLNSSAPNNRIAGNYIGTDITGTSAIPNTSTAVSIQNSSTGNIIGTNGDGNGDAAEGNLISGNTSGSISIISSSTNTVVAGNYIGTDVSGTLDLGNGAGIAINANNNRIGTNGNGVSDVLERNIISGNTGIGINFTGGTGTVVAGNYIGTNAAGTAVIANTTHGISLTGASSTIIGTNGDGNGDAAERNIISGNGGAGILLSGGSTLSNIIAGNLIGTDVTGTVDLGNSFQGIIAQGGSGSHTIGTNGDGTSDALEGNLVSGNGAVGVTIAASNNNLVAGNLIGTNLAGTASIGNTGVGISIQNAATGNYIGTNSNGSAGDANEGNTISGNNSNGLAISNDSTINYVMGNKIGTNPAAGFAVGNSGVGIVVSGSNNQIGTDGNGVRDALEINVVSGNTNHGISFLGSTAQNNPVAGNIIGLNAAASASLANGASGISIDNSASNNTIGGNADVQSNFIGGNSAGGILVTGANTTNNVINNNYIGTNAAQAVLPNGTNGIEISSTGAGTTTVTNNWIFYHPTTGILLSNAADLGAAGVSEQNCVIQNAAGLNNTTGINTFFENNWWGAVSGPSGVGTGNGDTVSANVDYIAFLTVAPTGCPSIAGVIIDPLALSATEGGTVGYTIMLDSQPAPGEIVTITITISVAAAGEIASTLPVTLTFDFDDTTWNIAQSFDITLNDDLIVNGNRSYIAAFTHSSDSTLATSGYDATAALVIDSVDLDVIDNETPNVVINPTAWSMVTGDSRTYDVSLTVEPSADVTISLTQLDANCTISTTTLTFTNSAGANPWNVPQQVMVTGVGAGGSTCTIQHDATGGGYDPVGISDVVVTLRRGPGNPQAPVQSPEIAVFDPAISKLGELLPGQTGIVGEELEWVVTVSNVGTVVGTNVIITDTLIPALQIDSVDAVGATVTIVGQTVTVVYPSLAVGQTVQFSIFTTVLSGVTVDNTACVNATNQGVQECASAISAVVSELPSTGESPLWRYALLMGIALLFGATAAMLLYRKPKTKN